SMPLPMYNVGAIVFNGKILVTSEGANGYSIGQFDPLSGSGGTWSVKGNITCLIASVFTSCAGLLIAVDVSWEFDPSSGPNGTMYNRTQCPLVWHYGGAAAATSTHMYTTGGGSTGSLFEEGTLP